LVFVSKVSRGRAESRRGFWEVEEVRETEEEEHQRTISGHPPIPRQRVLLPYLAIA
jgi:hypothetical protein